MALLRALARQEKLEKALLDIGECKHKVVSLEELSFSVTEIQNLTLAAVTYLSLNIRDCIMILNRQNPDADTGPDGEVVTVGGLPVSVAVEPGAEGEPGTDKEQEYPVTGNRS